MRNMASFSTSLNFEPLTFKNAARYLNAETNFCVGMIALCPRQVWWNWVNAPLGTVCQTCPIRKIAWRKRAKSTITQRWIIRFRWHFLQSLNVCMTPEVHWNFKVKRSKFWVTLWRNLCKNSQNYQPGIARFRSNFVQTLIAWRLMYHALHIFIALCSSNSSVFVWATVRLECQTGHAYSKGAHYFHRVVGLEVINIRQWAVSLRCRNTANPPVRRLIVWAASGSTVAMKLLTILRHRLSTVGRRAFAGPHGLELLAGRPPRTAGLTMRPLKFRQRLKTWLFSSY